MVSKWIITYLQMGVELGFPFPETNSIFAPENWWLEDDSFPFGMIASGSVLTQSFGFFPQPPGFLKWIPQQYRAWVESLSHQQRIEPHNRKERSFLRDGALMGPCFSSKGIVGDTTRAWFSQKSQDFDFTHNHAENHPKWKEPNIGTIPFSTKKPWFWNHGRKGKKSQQPAILRGSRPRGFTLSLHWCRSILEKWCVPVPQGWGFDGWHIPWRMGTWRMSLFGPLKDSVVGSLVGNPFLKIMAEFLGIFMAYFHWGGC